MTPRRAGDGRQAGSQALGTLLVGGPGAAPPGESLALSRRRTTVRQTQLQEEDCAVPMRARQADVVVRLRCKQWGCKSCGPWLKRRLRKSIVQACNLNTQLRRFYTLTLGSEWHRWKHGPNGDLVPNPAWNGSTRAEAYQELNRVWAAFAKRMERKLGHRLAYGSVREPHKNGTPHIHGLMDMFVSKEKLSQFWAEAGGGHTQIAWVEPHRVAAYLSKYLSKEGNPPPKGCRKYATGGGVKFENVRPPRPPRKEDASPWIVERQEVDGSWHTVRARLTRNQVNNLGDAMRHRAELARLAAL